MPLIEIENVSKRYGSVRALENVSLRMEGSGIMGLLGQNGAGKTTLINILTGYLAPTSGRALLGGHDPLMEPGEAKRHLGYLPEQPPLYDEMTVREYLRFVAALKGVAARAIPAHVDEVMELTGLTSMQSRLLGHLSKGFRQRAGMAQALCGDPDVLVLDEPVDGLDPVMRRQVWSLLMGDVAEHGTTVLVSSHNLRELEDVCDHVGILSRGKVLIERSLSDLQENVVKMQVVFQEKQLPQLPADLEILNISQVGRIHTLIVRGNATEVTNRLAAYAPILMEALPLTLEEIFIYELGGEDYAVRDIVL